MKQFLRIKDLYNTSKKHTYICCTTWVLPNTFQETFKNFFTEYFISFSKGITPPGCEKESSREKY